MGAKIESSRGIDNRSEGEKEVEKVKLKREGELKYRASVIVALREQASVLLSSPKDMLGVGIDPNNSKKQWIFDSNLGKLIKVADNLKYELINCGVVLSDMQKPIGTWIPPLIPSKEIDEANRVIDEVRQFLSNLTKKYPAYKEDPELMEIMTGDTQTQG